MQKIFFLCFLLCYFLSAQAQKQDSLLADSLKKDGIILKKHRTTSGFHFVVNRTFLMNSDAIDSVPLRSASSGSLFLGAGYVFDVSRKISLTMQPGINAYKLNYENVNNQPNIFPPRIDSTRWFLHGGTEINSDSAVSLLSLKHRIMYVEMPVGVSYTFNRDKDNDRKTYIEAGVFGGFKLGTTYKRKYLFTNPLDNISQLVTEKNRLGWYTQFLRYGAYARFGYKFTVFQVSYRLSNVFDPTIGGVPIPSMPRLEAGIGFVL